MDNCSYCDKSINNNLIKGKLGIYCSKLCSQRHRRGVQLDINRECIKCGKALPVNSRADKIYCSDRCKDKVKSNKEIANLLLENIKITDDKGVKVLKSSCNQDILVDSSLYLWLSKYPWNISKSKGYPTYKGMSMHFLLKTLWGWQNLLCDHKDRNKLNNTQENLRPATISQNNANKPPANTASGYKGVHKTKSKKWQAIIYFKGKNHNIGSFDFPEDAAKAYDAKALEIFGDFAYQNFPLLPEDKQND